MHRFKNQYGGEFEELKSQAFYGFMWAIETYKPNKSKFTTWLRFVVYKSLQNEHIKELKFKRMRDSDKVEVNSQNGLGELFADLGNDAKTIVQLILNTPKDLMLCIESVDGDIDQVKSALFSYLKSNGWSRRRISHAYKQIGRALA